MIDAVQFLKTAYRLCDEYDGLCRKCPLYGEETLCVLDLGVRTDDIEKAVEAVEEWGLAHPILTNAMKFKEVFGFEHPHTTECIKESTPYGWWDEPYQERVIN